MFFSSVLISFQRQTLSSHTVIELHKPTLLSLIGETNFNARSEKRNISQKLDSSKFIVSDDLSVESEVTDINSLLVNSSTTYR